MWLTSFHRIFMSIRYNWWYAVLFRQHCKTCFVECQGPEANQEFLELFLYKFAYRLKNLGKRNVSKLLETKISIKALRNITQAMQKPSDLVFMLRYLLIFLHVWHFKSPEILWKKRENKNCTDKKIRIFMELFVCK